MKILIVDDEELTRTGLVSSIDWNSLGIDEVFQADDGVKGLEIARLHKPEIILCDVRMPRMSGIAMLEEVEKILPDTVPIFMSGYSDKEYLKAAIKLKTVNYIEKPLDADEICEAVLSAAEMYAQKQNSHQGEALHSMQTISRLALALTSPSGVNQDEIRELGDELDLHFNETTEFAALIFHLQSVPEDAQSVYDGIYLSLTQYLKDTKLHCLYTEKKPQHIVYFLFGDPDFPTAEMESASQFLGEQFARLGKYLATVGEIQTGLGGAYQSYSSAVILLQSSFFFPAYTLLTPELFSLTASAAEIPADFSAENDFSKVLSQTDPNACDQFLDDLFHIYQNSHTLMPNQIRDLYYKLFLILEDARRQQHLEDLGKSENIMDEIENAFTYDELHQALVDKVQRFLNDVRNAASENVTITLIRDYIGKNYMNEMLSVKDISSHVFLSVSYVCTFFKNETGQTLNQYLTEYRMEKSKELLKDPQYKISDVSSKVGYSDGNYFSKTFRKYTGLSPSEYREKMTR